MRSSTPRMRLLQRAGAGVLFVALWWAISHFGPWPRFLLPDPFEVVKRLFGMAADGSLWGAILVSMWRLIRGYGLALLIGLPLGIAMGQSVVVRNAVRPLVMGLQEIGRASCRERV